MVLALRSAWGAWAGLRRPHASPCAPMQVRNWTELSRVVAGLVQVALLTHRWEGGGGWVGGAAERVAGKGMEERIV
jgi:hypothetical protein